ncbi:hypothetical protein FACS1894219_00510 [Clostridia bacterium]|nr:hypothetical protein FACS1894219_00510 [Clostridia bacterium]
MAANQHLLDISTIPMRLDVSFQRATLSAKSGKEEYDRRFSPLEIENKKAETHIKTDPIKIKIDRKEMYYSMERYVTPELFRRHVVEEAKAHALEVIGTIKDEARSVGETNGASLQQIWRNRGGKMPTKIVSSYMPKVRPQVWTEGGTVDISPVYYSLEMRWNVDSTPPQADYTPARVKTDVGQWNKVNIKYLGTLEDTLLVNRDTANRLSIKV